MVWPLNLVGDFKFFFYGRPFIHDGFVYMEATNPKSKLGPLNLNV